MSKNKSLPYLDPALCGFGGRSKILGDRWVLLILREAFYGVTRFETLLSHTHITRQTLTTRLKTMTETGLLNKVPYREAGSRERYEYVLTDKSRSGAGAVRPDGMGPPARAAQCAAYSIGGQRQRRGCPSGVYYCQRHRGEPRRPADRQGRRTLIAPLQNFRTPLAKAAASGYVA